MRRIAQKIAPQDKILSVANKTGNPFIKKMQGTTKMAWDSLLIQDNVTNYDFFKDSNERSFPFTNVKNDQLKAGEALAVQRISFGIIEVPQDPGTVVGNVVDFEAGTAPGTGFEPLRVGTFEIEIANDIVMKPIRLQHILPQFNKNAYNNESNVFEMNTDLVIMPNLDFRIGVRTQGLTVPGTATDDFYLTCVIEGVGAQINLKENM
jgi:hypothetical protein